MEISIQPEFLLGIRKFLIQYKEPEQTGWVARFVTRLL
jgi:hypothetical protein